MKPERSPENIIIDYEEGFRSLALKYIEIKRRSGRVDFYNATEIFIAMATIMADFHLENAKQDDLLTSVPDFVFEGLKLVEQDPSERSRITSHLYVFACNILAQRVIDEKRASDALLEEGPDEVGNVASGVREKIG